MSTFDGIVEEFPFIRIDYFRKNPDRPAPLVGFLSHVHSDHLQGLESWRAPFIYCSMKTREILLRLEKYPHRMNFSKGILESRKQHYKHLAKILRPIPLNTPTEIELTPRIRIRVTLLDANHCVGSVMFLVEGEGKAILYTGDIRAETWWINQLARNPVLIPYASHFKFLATIYLDTTFAVKSRMYATFPPKADGIKELLQKIASYPADTIFYFRAWTFGYEDVWQALAAALRTSVHLDRYQLGLYQSLFSGTSGAENSDDCGFLCGFRLGNKFVPGCLSSNELSRIHSCEPGVVCSVVTSGQPVYITPIVNRLRDGSEVLELGAGGGGGDLYQIHELELPDKPTVEQLEKVLAEQIPDSVALFQVKKNILEAYESKKSLSLDDYGLRESAEISLRDLITALSHGHKRYNHSFTGDMGDASSSSATDLPRTIRFPYSRHSSYAELCELVSLFRPRDIYPCTVDVEKWDECTSMESLFGHLCSSNDFRHDAYMRELQGEMESEGRPTKRTRSTSPISSNMTSSIEMGVSQDKLHSTLFGPEINDMQPIILNEEQATRESNQIPASFPVDLASQRSPNHDHDQHHDSQSKEQQFDSQTRRDLNDRVRSLRDHLIQLQDQAKFTIARLPPNTAADHLHQGPSRSESAEHNNQLHGPLSPASPLVANSTEVLTDPDSQPRGIDIMPEIQGQESSSPVSSVSLQRRLEAYQAAQEGTYEAWSEFALVSAGNNHTQPEPEF